MSDLLIRKNDFGPQQQEEISRALEGLIKTLCTVAPRLGGHFLSGGTVEFKTMSGAQLRFGFSPGVGGIIIPGGIRPAGQNGGIIK